MELIDVLRELKLTDENGKEVGNIYDYIQFLRRALETPVFDKEEAAEFEAFESGWPY